ncbi:MAG: DUF1016 family protein [Bacteriovoracaceae bacterium]|nr:DUF1016 family protein [Bacteriovoracaceae bacterium]
MKVKNKPVDKKETKDFNSLLKEIKTRIQQSQAKAVLAVNSELIRLYWDVGRTIDQKQTKEGWGTQVIPRLAKELSGELSELKGFSTRNLERMVAFYRGYPDQFAIPPQAVAELESNVFWSIPWGHHILLMEKIKEHNLRIWYMQQILKNGWSRNTLSLMIESRIHQRQGKSVSNFAELLPPSQSDLIQQELKDPYVFDFLTLQDTFHERELEVGLLKYLQQFLLELGQGFAFVGRQYCLELDGNEFYVDLLFYHLKLRCYIVIDLKKGKFKPDYAGKMNFYLNVVDDKLKAKADAPSIGLILCQNHNKIVAEYALRGVEHPIGISEYELTRALPKNLKSSLPTIEEIESELAESIKRKKQE